MYNGIFKTYVFCLACIIPTDYKGDWYWMSNDGSDAVSNVNNQQFADMRCVEIKIHYNNASNVEGVNSTMLMQKMSVVDKSYRYHYPVI